MSIVVTTKPVFSKNGQKIIVDKFDIETDVHDPDRQMGAELVHTVKAYIDDIELEWLVYEYASFSINDIEFNKYNDDNDTIELLKEPEFEVFIENDDMDYEQDYDE